MSEPISDFDVEIADGWAGGGATTTFRLCNCPYSKITEYALKAARAAGLEKPQVIRWRRVP